jgi:hypothetical protein
MRLDEHLVPTIAGTTMKVVELVLDLSPMGGVLRSYISNIPA